MKLLIIEDEASLQELMTATLKKEGYVVENAMDYNEAMDKLGAYNYDCVLLDLNLPGGNGLDILEHIKKKSNNEIVTEEVSDVKSGKIKIPWYVIGFFITCALFTFNIITPEISNLFKLISNKDDIFYGTNKEILLCQFQKSNTAQCRTAEMYMNTYFQTVM